mmetsp:Transcript_47680/g.108191  ORF Transcript_47680/g.108191 Transcript_47680/m.108191 type:complete len:548 (-) Transcript_47680:35-1678(-)
MVGHPRPAGLPLLRNRVPVVRGPARADGQTGPLPARGLHPQLQVHPVFGERRPRPHVVLGVLLVLRHQLGRVRGVHVRGQLPGHLSDRASGPQPRDLPRRGRVLPPDHAHLGRALPPQVQPDQGRDGAPGPAARWGPRAVEGLRRERPHRALLGRAAGAAGQEEGHLPHEGQGRGGELRPEERPPHRGAHLEGQQPRDRVNRRGGGNRVGGGAPAHDEVLCAVREGPAPEPALLRPGVLFGLPRPRQLRPRLHLPRGKLGAGLAAPLHAPRPPDRLLPLRLPVFLRLAAALVERLYARAGDGLHATRCVRGAYAAAGLRLGHPVRGGAGHADRRRQERPPRCQERVGPWQRKRQWGEVSRGQGPEVVAIPKVDHSCEAGGSRRRLGGARGHARAADPSRQGHAASQQRRCQQSEKQVQEPQVPGCSGREGGVDGPAEPVEPHRGHHRGHRHVRGGGRLRVGPGDAALGLLVSGCRGRPQPAPPEPTLTAAASRVPRRERGRSDAHGGRARCRGLRRARAAVPAAQHAVRAAARHHSEPQRGGDQGGG